MSFNLCFKQKITRMLPQPVSAENKIKTPANTKKYPEASITESFTNGFFTVDRAWTVKYWNKAAEKILRVKAEDIVGENLWKKFAGIIPIELYAIDQRTFLKDVPVHFEEYWGEMGAWFDVITYHCDNTLSVSFKSSNHPHVQDPETLGQQLKVLTELYRFVTEITNDCLWEWNLQEKEIFWIDGGHKRTFGYQVENALIPQSFWEQCIHPDDIERVLKGLNRVIKQRTSSLWKEEYRFKAADGNYLFISDRGHIIYDEKGKACRMIGATQDITEKIVLQKKLALERLTRQREITDAVLTAQENERTLIGTELNENLNQLLVAVKLNIQMAKKDSGKRDICLKNSTEYLDHVIDEMKRIYKTLVLPDILVTGLFDNIKNLVHDLNKTHHLKFNFLTRGIDEEEDLDKNIQLDIFRIVQEQLNNIIKHANATRATIKLNRLADNVVLSISDNGNGCDTKTEKNGVGLINITSRTELYGGTVNIASKPGRGYTLKIALPCVAV